jgi:hypothetical protein
MQSVPITTDVSSNLDHDITEILLKVLLNTMMVLFLSLIFCKQEEKLLFFGSVSGCTCLILAEEENNTHHHF